jgi:hypothetical protein
VVGGLCDDAQMHASAPDPPKEVLVLHRRCRHDLSARDDHACREQLVNEKAVEGLISANTSTNRNANDGSR